MIMELYTTKKGCFKKGELTKLASALGFPSDILLKELTKSTDSTLQYEYTRLQAGKSITEKNLKYMLESGVLNLRLEKTFNRYDAKYNVKLIVKAMSLLHHRQLTYSEISEGRVAFELYSMVDGSGLPAELEPVSQALKLMERVMAPRRLEAEIQKQQYYCELPSRIQMYEFFDLVVKCVKSSQATRDMEINDRDESILSETKDVSLPDLSKILMTTDQQVLDYLDERYRESLYRRVDPTPNVLDDQHIVSMAPRRMLSTVSKEHSCIVIPPLERSQQKLHQARNGTMVLSADQHVAVEGLSRPHTCPNIDCRSRDDSGAPVKVHLRRRPWQTRNLTHKPVEDPLLESKSVPNILHDSHGHTVVDDDVTDTICNICVDSVHRARETLRSSLASLPQHQVASTMVQLKDSRIAMPSKCTPTPTHTPLTPIVTNEEIRRHQDTISELEWERLKRRHV